jgi:Fe-S cluster assembly protein SufD
MSATAAATVARRDVPASFVSQFEEFERLRSAEPEWLRTVRTAAFDHVRQAGLPTGRDEQWRFTSVAPIAATRFSTAPRETAVDTARLRSLLLSGASAAELVFVDGRYAPQLSSAAGTPPGTEALSLASVLRTHGALIESHLARSATAATFAALNTGFFEDGAFVRLPADAVVEAPICLFFISTLPFRPTMVHPRVLILAGPNSRATFVERYLSLRPGVGLTNAFTQLVVGDGAVVHHCRLHDESVQAFHVGGVDARLGRASSFTSHSFVVGGALVRNDLAVGFEGEGSECTLNGLYLAAGGQLVDTHTFIDHAVPNCSSHEVYRGILDGTSRAVFCGKIIVRQDAQKTDAKQTNRVLLLSDTAQVNTMPQLEIFADDVKCTHGAAVGMLDDAALLYLRSRGIGRREAREMLIRSFAGEVIGRVPVMVLRAQLEEMLDAWLARSEEARLR